MYSKNAIDNLMNKYQAVLKKCTLLNSFCSLALAIALVAGGGGILEPLGIDIAHARSLNEITTNTTAPTETVTGGNLSSAVDAVFAGISGDGSVTGFNNTFGFPASLTLTGLGATGGVLATGNLSVTSAATLILGTNASPAITSINGRLLVSGAYRRGAGNTYYSIAELASTHLTVNGGVIVEKAARFFINDNASLTTNTLDINYNGGALDVAATPTVYVGAFGSNGSGEGNLIVTGDAGINLEDGHLYVGDGSIETKKITGVGSRPAILVGAIGNAAHKGYLDVTGADGIHFSGTGGSIVVTNGTLKAQKITITSDARITVGDERQIHGVGTLNVGELSLSNESYLDALSGVANLTTISLSNGAFVRVGAKEGNGKGSAQVNISAPSTYDVGIFTQPTFIPDGSLVVTQKAFGKIAIGSVGTYNIDNHLTLTTNTSSDLNIVGILSADTIDIGNGNNNLTIAGGTLRTEGDINAGTITIDANTAQIVRVSTIFDNQPNAGALELASNSAANLNAQIIVNNANASLIVSAGSWTAHKAISVQQGKLVVNGASLDTNLTSLSVRNKAEIDISSGTLTAKLSDFGSIDLSQASGSKFTNNSANIASNLVGNAGSFLRLKGFSSSVILGKEEYDLLKEELRIDIFGIGSTVGSITIEGVSIDVPALETVTADTNSPTGIIGAGTLSTNLNLIYGAVLLSETSQINNGSLTLTGLGSGNVLSEGSLNVQGGSLILGYSNNDLKSPDNSIVGGALLASGAGSTITVEHTIANVISKVDLQSGSKLTIEATGGIVTPDFNMNAASATVTGTLDVTGEGMQIESGATITATGTISTTNLVLDNAQITASNDFIVTGEDGASLINDAELTLIGAKSSSTSIKLQGSTLTVGNGSSEHEFTTSELTLDTNSKVILKDKASVILDGDFTIDAGTLSATETGGKIAVESGSGFHVSEALNLSNSTFNVGGVVSGREINVSDNVFNITGGTLRSYGGKITGKKILLDGGNFELFNGSGERLISSDIEINNAASRLHISDSDWQIDKTITIKNGELSILNGSTVTSFLHSQITMTGGKLTVAGGSSLIVLGDLDMSGGTADISGGALKADISHFGTIDLSAASGSKFNKVSGEGIEITLDTDGKSKIVISGFGGGVVLSPGEYFALLKEVLNDITGEELAILTIEGISYDTNLFTLTDIAIPVEQENSIIKAGDLTAGVEATFAGVFPSETVPNSTINSTAAILNLTGLGNANGIVVQGDIEVIAGTLNIGVEGKSPENVIAQGKITASGENSKLNIQGTTLNSLGGVSIENSAVATIVVNGGLTTEKFAMDKGKTIVKGTLSIDNGQVMSMKNASILEIDNGRVQSHNIEMADSTIDVNEGGYLYVYDMQQEASPTVIKGNFKASNSTVNIAEGGTVSISAYDLSESKINIAGTLQLLGEQNLNIAKVGKEGDGEWFNIASKGVLSSAGVLTLDTTASNTLTTDGTLASQDIIVNGSMNIASGTLKSLGGTLKGDAITVNGGTLELAGGVNTGTSTLENTVNVTSGAMKVSAGNWISSQDIVLSGGELAIDGGSLTSKNISFANNASLSIANGVLDVSNATLKTDASFTGTLSLEKGGTLRAKLSDFGTVAGETFTVTLNTKLTSYYGSNLVLKGSSASMNLTDYQGLVGDANGKIFDGIINNGAITFDGISVDTSGNTLNDIKQIGLGLNAANQSISAGSLNAAGAQVTFSHVQAGVGTQNATISAGTLTLTGNSSGGVLSIGDLATTSAGAAINIGSSTLATAQDTTIQGNLIANAGTVQVQNTSATVQGKIAVNSSGTLAVKSGATLNAADTFTIGEQTSIGNVNIANTATLNVKELIMNRDSILLVGDGTSLAGKGGTFVAETASLQQGMIFLDPAWFSGANIENASSGAIANFSAGIDGALVMGQHSYMVLGDASTQWAQDSFVRSGLNWGPSGISAALFVRKPQTLDTKGAIIVNGALTVAPSSFTGGNIVFADKSLLMIDANTLSKDAAISVNGVGKLAVASTSKLYIENGTNDTYTIIDNVTIANNLSDGTTGGTVAGGVWSTNNVQTTSSATFVQDVIYDAKNQAFEVTLKNKSIVSDYALMQSSMVTLIDSFVLGSGPDTNSDNMGMRFISRAIDNNYLGRNKSRLATTTIEGAAQMSAVGAVPSSTLNTSQVMTNAIIERTSLAKPAISRMVSTQDENTPLADKEEAPVSGSEYLNEIESISHRIGLWTMPLYHSSIGSGFESGNFNTGYTSDLAGLALGADVSFNDNARIGAAFNIGAGNSTSSGDFNETTNDFDFWGVILYGGLHYNNFGLTLDMGYNVNTNELTQLMPRSMNMGNLSGSVISSAWTTGLRAEYLWETKYLNITPHIGIRHTVLNTGKYYVRSGGNVFEVEASNQSITTIPVGIALSKDFTVKGGFIISPQLDIGYVVAMGDLEARTKVGIPAVLGSSELNLKTFDKNTLTGGLGLKVQKNNFSFGVNYNTQIAEHKTDHSVFGFVRYEFGAGDTDTYETREYGISEGRLIAEPVPANQEEGTSEDTPLLLGGATQDSTDTAQGEVENYDNQPTLLSNATQAQNSAQDEAENSDNQPTLLIGATAEQAQDTSGEVHLLAPVEVRGIEIGSGSYSIRGDVLRTLPNSTGTITGALKTMANVQFSNAEQSSQQGGEIAPPRISIYGSKPYENNFLIDGMSVSNTLNPSGLDGASNGSHVGGPNYLIPGGGDQDIFYDTQLIEEIVVYTNNVPAKYGNFSGGVIDATLRDPRSDKWRFRVAGKNTSSSWYDVRDANKDSETSASQPKFDIYNVSATAEGPITDTLAVLLGYSNRHSFIPLQFENEEGEISTKNQYRLSQNFFGKLAFTPTKDLTLRLDASYAPYEDLRWREKWPESEQTMHNDALRLALQAEYRTDAGDFDFKFSYLRSGYSTEAASSLIEKNIAESIQRGGYGSREIEKNEFASNFDYTSPLIRTGWLNWQIESGFDVNVTGVNMWAEETRTNIVVALTGSPHVLTTNALYPETNQYNTMTTLGFYLQGELNVERFTFTPGFRIDADNLTNNIDISPRLKLEVDVFNNEMFRVVGGYSRYYGTALREYAFSRYRQFQNTQHYFNTDTGVSTTTYSLGASRDYDIAGLDTPYSDEYTVGILGNVWGVDYTLDYTMREHKNQLISEETGEQIVRFGGKDHVQSIYELTNKGFSNYQGVTLTLGHTLDMGRWWGSHYIGFGATVSKFKTFEGSYDDDISLNSDNGYNYNSSQVYYDGQLINRSDMDATDYNSPLTLTLNIQSSMIEDRLRINWLNRWKGDSQGVLRDELLDRDTPNGTTSGSNIDKSNEWLIDGNTYALAYREGTIKGGLISDVNIEFDILKEEDYTVGVSLDVYNIFNSDIGVAAADPGLSSEGRSFWIGVYAEF